MRRLVVCALLLVMTAAAVSAEQPQRRFTVEIEPVSYGNGVLKMTVRVHNNDAQESVCVNGLDCQFWEPLEPGTTETVKATRKADSHTVRLPISVEPQGEAVFPLEITMGRSRYNRETSVRVVIWTGSGFMVVYAPCKKEKARPAEVVRMVA